MYTAAWNILKYELGDFSPTVYTVCRKLCERLTEPETACTGRVCKMAEKCLGSTHHSAWLVFEFGFVYSKPVVVAQCRSKNIAPGDCVILD